MSLAANESFLLKIDKRTIWDRSANRLNQVGSIGGTIIGASTDPNRPDLGYGDAESIFYHSITGNDGNPGTRVSPKKTVEACNPFVDETTIFQVVKLDSQDESFAIISKRLQADNGIAPKIIKTLNWAIKISATSFDNRVIGIVKTPNRFILISSTHIQITSDNGNTFTLILNAPGWDTANRSIEYGNGKAVIGGNGVFQISTNEGSTWTKITTILEGSHIIEDISYSITLGLWVATTQQAADGKIITSPDALTWTVRLDANNAWGQIAWGQSAHRFVIIGDNNLVQWSANGIDWVAATGSFTGNSEASGIVYSEASELFVAVGGGDLGSGTSYEIQVSPDGITWVLGAKPTGWDSNRIRSIFFDSDTNIMTMVGHNGRIAHSTDGSTWTFDSGSADAGDLIFIGGRNGILFTSSLFKDVQVLTQDTVVNADLSGFILDDLIVELDALLKNCTLDGGLFELKDNFKLLNNNGSDITFTGKPAKPGMLISTCEFIFTTMLINLLSGDDFTIENCRLQSNGIPVFLGADDIAVSIFIKDNLIISGSNNDALALSGYAADAESYLISQNTVIGNISVFNRNGADSNFEKFRDNVIELYTIFYADAQNVLVESGNVRGGALSGVTLAPVVSIIDPLFKIDPPDYELRRLSEGGLSDSPLIGKSVFETYLHLGNPFPRDLGAYNLNNENTSTEFLSGMPMPKPKNGGILHEIRNSFNFNIPKSGNPQQVNRPDERIEIIEIVYKGTVDSKVRNFIDQLESLTDLTIFLNMDQQTIPGITFTVSGIHDPGSFVLDIDPVNIPIGSRFSFNDIDYWVINRDTIEPANAKKLVLSRDLVDEIPDSAVIKIFDSPGQGEFQYLQQENKKEVQDLSRIDNTRSGLRLMFIRKKI